jgi:hypothetical protein
MCLRLCLLIDIILVELLLYLLLLLVHERIQLLNVELPPSEIHILVEL